MYEMDVLTGRSLVSVRNKPGYRTRLLGCPVQNGHQPLTTGQDQVGIEFPTKTRELCWLTRQSRSSEPRTSSPRPYES